MDGSWERYGIAVNALKKWSLDEEHVKHAITTLRRLDFLTTHHGCMKRTYEMYCEHHNLVLLGCSKCGTFKKKEIGFEEDLDCPAWNLSPSEFCNNGGCYKIKTTSKQFVFRCSDCWFEWKQFKKSVYPTEGTKPKIVECVICGGRVIEPESRISDSTCNQCGRNYFREHHPKLVRD